MRQAQKQGAAYFFKALKGAPKGTDTLRSMNTNEDVDAHHCPRNGQLLSIHLACVTYLRKSYCACVSNPAKRFDNFKIQPHKDNTFKVDNKSLLNFHCGPLK